MTLLAPQTEVELAEAVSAAYADGAPLRLLGAGSKTGLGRPVSGTPLSLQAFRGVALYEPEELVLTVGAGTPRREVEAILAERGQHFAFEPIDHGPLLGLAPGQGSIGGMVAVGASGPRRIQAGALRDHLLGFRGVTGRGEIVKSGGRVMKNVTGYDLSKLVAGSFGTLVALTEVTFKVLPKPETEATLLLACDRESAALAALRAAAAAPVEASGLAVLPPGTAPLRHARCAAVIRLEAPAISVARRLDDLRARLGGKADALGASESAALWRALRDAAPVAAREGQIWRVSTAPTDGLALVAALRDAGAPLIAYFYDWAGGLVWLCLAEAPDAHAELIRARLRPLGGHATLVRASAEIRSRIDVFQPQPPALAALSRRLKESFDPQHVLERGRMRAF